MKKLVIIATLAFAFAAFAGEHHSALKSSPGFDKLKSLIGEWTTNVPNMGKVTATYSIHSDGSALLEELKMPDGASMITVYYPAGDDVTMTHYCSGHNQPHMKASGTDASTLKFKTTSVENLASKDAEYMDAVQFTFADADHFTATWTNASGGKKMSVPFEFTRVR